MKRNLLLTAFAVVLFYTLGGEALAIQCINCPGAPPPPQCGGYGQPVCNATSNCGTMGNPPCPSVSSGGGGACFIQGNCDPGGTVQATCLTLGLVFDPLSCHCGAACNSAGAADCLVQGGTWQPATCLCNIPPVSYCAQYVAYVMSTISYEVCDANYQSRCFDTSQCQTVTDCHGVTLSSSCTDYSSYCQWEGLYCSGCPSALASQQGATCY